MIPYPDEMGNNRGLSSLGFGYDPFGRLEASNDRFLPEYLIGHDMFSVAWEPAQATLFAPAGGGKTAMRIYTLRTCWLSSQKKRFPISYDLPFFSPGRSPLSLLAHQRAIAAASATDLVLVCAYRPNIYTELPPERRTALVSLIQQALPVDLEWAIGLLEETGSAEQLSFHLDRTFVIPEPAAPNVIQDFCRLLKTDLSRSAQSKISPDALFAELLKSITRDLGYESVFLLLDGVDGVSGTANNAVAQFEAMEPLCEQALRWAQQQVYLKAFLPLELETVIASRADTFYRNSRHAVITWQIPDLAMILRRRVRVASRGKFDSLDAISSRALRNVETLIAQRARPLPRESIVLAGLVLDRYFARCSGVGELELEDIADAEEQYQKGMHFPERAQP